MKKGVILLSLLLVFGSLIMIFQTNEQESIVIDTYIKNLNWNSPLQKDVPYVVGNDVELYYILEKQNGREVEIDIRQLEKKLDISKIEIGGREVEITDKIDLEYDQTSPLKITGVTKKSNNQEEGNIKDLLTININEPLLKDTQGDMIIEDDLVIDNSNLDYKSPNNILLSQNEFNSNINNVLILSGDNIKNISFLNIGGYSYIPNIKEEKAYFFLEKSTFDTGKYFVIIQEKNNNIITLDQQITFQYSNKSINIANITPDSISNQKKSFIVLQGNGFDKVVSLQLDNNVIIKKTSFHVINDHVLTVEIPEGLTPGNYHFNIMTTSQIVEVDNLKFTIIQ